MSNGVGAVPQLQRILLVDRDEHARLIYGAILEHRGYAVALESSCDDAIRIAEHEAAHLLVIDPHACEEPSVARLHAVARERGIPTLALTARVTEPDLTAVCSAGFDAVLIKPIPPSDVADAVHAALNGLVICSAYRKDR